MQRWSGSTVCVLVGESLDLDLMNVAIASLPGELLSGFVVMGPSALRPLARRKGCRGHFEIELASSDIAAARDCLATLPKGAVVVAVDEKGGDFVSELPKGDWLLAPVSPASVSRELRHKWNFFHLCRRLDIPVPQTELFSCKEAVNFDRLAGSLGLPIVFKPTDASESQGVVILRSREDFEQRVLNEPTYNFAPLLAQSYVPGEDLDISVLASNGEVLHCAIQTRSNDKIVFLHSDHLLTLTKRLIKGSGYSGFAHFDTRLRSDGTIELIECNARIWFSLQSSTWCGLNFLRCAIDLAQGRRSAEPFLMPIGASPLKRSDFLKMLLLQFKRWKDFTADQKHIAQDFFVTFAYYFNAAIKMKIQRTLG